MRLLLQAFITLISYKDGHTSSVRDKILSIRVKRGWKAGTRVTFKEEGDQGPNTIPADMGKLISKMLSHS